MYYNESLDISAALSARPPLGSAKKGAQPADGQATSTVHELKGRSPG